MDGTFVPCIAITDPELFETGKVKEVTIKRVSLKTWYPVFQIDDEQLGQIACSIRVNKEHELRTLG